MPIPMIAALRALAFLAATMLAVAPAHTAGRSTPSAVTRTAASVQDVKQLRFGRSRLLVTFSPAEFDLTEQEVLDWVMRSARAAATYFGRFPVAEVRIALEPTDGDDVTEGQAWATPDSNIRVYIGRRTTVKTLKSDTTLVHEMTHLAFPDLDEAHLWLHEGIATYVEAVASAQASEMAPNELWAHFVAEMPQGLPERGDHGLDDTPSEDRRYWGGAMFCLVADVEIRRRTANRFGLRDALRAVLEAGGTLAHTWEVEHALDIGDKAVGASVLRELFAGWKDKSVAPDLDALWDQLGVHKVGSEVRLVDSAPLAPIRDAIGALPSRPLLLVEPSLLHETTRR